MRGAPALLTLAIAALTSADKLAEIRGRVLDTEGEPVAGVTIMVLRSTVTNGRRESLISKMATTNDRGEYRVAELPPGRYLVKAAGFQQTSVYLGDDPPMPNTQETFEPTWFPRAQNEDTAAPVVLAPGAEAHADFLLELKPGRRIRGRITNLIPYQPVALQLFARGEDVALSRSSINQENGSFEIRGVLDGAYRLRVIQLQPNQELLFAERRIEVAGKDLDGIELALSPGWVMKGTVRLDGAAEELEDRGGVEISLVPLEGFRCASEPACVIPSHAISPREFEIRSLIPGRYRVWVAAYGAVYVKSAKTGGADLLATTELVIGTGGPPQIEIVLAADGAKVSGSIVGPEVNALVLMAAESMARPPLTQTVDEDGSFTFYDVPPGTYRLHAFRQSAEVEYAAPRILRQLAGSGMRVEVQPGGEVTVRLQALTETPR